MHLDRVPILTGDGCDNLTATKNYDGIFRVTTNLRLNSQNDEEVEAVIEIERALLHIEALDNDKDIIRMIIPKDENIAESFPEPSKEEWELLGFNAPQED